MVVTITRIPRSVHGGKSKRFFFEVRKNGRHMADTTTKAEAERIARKLRRK